LQKRKDLFHKIIIKSLKKRRCPIETTVSTGLLYEKNLISTSFPKHIISINKRCDESLRGVLIICEQIENFLLRNLLPQKWGNSSKKTY
jgi:hypothetical protein